MSTESTSPAPSPAENSSEVVVPAQHTTVNMSRVQIPPLSDDNYALWTRLIKAHLVERDLGAALLDEPKPPAPVDQKAKAVLVLHISPHLLTLVDEKLSTFQVLNVLKAHFSGRNLIRLVQLRREFSSIRMQPKEKVSAFYSRVIELRDRLLLAGQEVPDSEVSMNLLAGLPEKFYMVIEAIGGLNLSLPDIVQRLEATEGRFTSTEPPSSGGALALAANGKARRPIDYSKPPKGPCPKCGNNGHWGRDCPNSQDSSHQRKSGTNPVRTVSRETRTCYTCGKTGHIARDCPMRPTASANVAGSDCDDLEEFSGTRHAVAFAADGTTKHCRTRTEKAPSAHTSAILDSGASHHMCPSKSLFHRYTTNLADAPTHVSLGSKEKVPVIGRGDLYLQTTDSSRVLFKDVLHVPQLTHCLLSLPKICLKGGVALFANSHCTVSVQAFPIFKAELACGVYRVTGATYIEPEQERPVQTEAAKEGTRNPEKFPEKNPKVLKSNEEERKNPRSPDIPKSTMKEAKLRRVSFGNIPREPQKFPEPKSALESAKQAASRAVAPFTVTMVATGRGGSIERDPGVCPSRDPNIGT